MKKIVLIGCIVCSICYVYFLFTDRCHRKDMESIQVIEASHIFGKRKKEYRANDKEAQQEQKIRVLLMNNQKHSPFHDVFSCYSESGMICVSEEGIALFSPYEECVLHRKRGDMEPVLLLAHGNRGIHIRFAGREEEQEYFGRLHIYQDTKGMVIVNELPVEDYLLFVVPSEMPASYPCEALKAQAVVARSYAYFHMKDYAYEKWKAHVDDTVSYQVYHNLAPTEATTKAVKETENQVLMKNHEIQECMYFSTSPGKLSSKEKNFRNLMQQQKKTDLENEEPWYRWQCNIELSVDAIRQEFMKYADEDEQKIIGKAKKIKNIQVKKRSESGSVEELSIKTDAGNVCISSAYRIRDFLVQREVAVEKADNTIYRTSTILPSPFFYIADMKNEQDKIVLLIKGGGFGHGTGMSQNGAKRLAQANRTFQEILRFYYPTYAIQMIQE